MLVGLVALWHVAPAAAQAHQIAGLPDLRAELPSTLPGRLSAADDADIRARYSDVIARLRPVRQAIFPVLQFHLPDVAIYTKAVLWALRYSPSLSADDIALIKRTLSHAEVRLSAAEAGSAPWERLQGRLVRGFISDVDGSVQPYGLIVPSGYRAGSKMRLDVVLHGSVKPDGMAIVHFLRPYDRGGAEANPAPSSDFIELFPMGRVENCSRWAGETDVFEAIEDVCRRYSIDRDRIVLRGMSAGASSTWHLGLKHPDQFAALGPYCGYVDTHRFSETPGMGFLKVGPLPDYQEKMLHMLDSVDYAANAGVVPVVAAIGDKDPFFQAHVIMGEAFRREGLQMVNLISPGTAHVQDPKNWAEQMRRIAELVEKGENRAPRHIRFVTWTLKYSRCHWLQVLALGAHYERAEIEARVADNGDIAVSEPRNVVRFAILPPMLQKPGARLSIGGQEVALPGLDRRLALSSGRRSVPDEPGGQAGSPARPIILERRGGHWAAAGADARPTGKRPGLQGPIDDAFTSRFLCVRGTGKPWSAAVQAWSDATLRRFAYEWSRYFAGDLPVKNDTEVTAEDCRRCNLILFGDPGSNIWIRKALPALPLKWSKTALQIGAMRLTSADHSPACIAPSPFTGPGDAGRYVLINSGHTFHESELAKFNYLLFPRLGDWAVFAVDPDQPAAPADPLHETLVESGLCDEQWKLTR